MLHAISGSRAPRFNNDGDSVCQVVALHAVLYVMLYASADANGRAMSFKIWMAQRMRQEVDLNSRSRGNTSSWSLTKSIMQSLKMSTSKYEDLSFHLSTCQHSSRRILGKTPIQRAEIQRCEPPRVFAHDGVTCQPRCCLRLLSAVWREIAYRPVGCCCCGRLRRKPYR